MAEKGNIRGELVEVDTLNAGFHIPVCVPRGVRAKWKW